MESPVVVDKPPEYANGGNGNERGFPFDDEESGAWSQLASRHPDIAARLRARPQTWARKRRPSGNDPQEEGDQFGGFPFDDIPPEFREHFPTHWNRNRYPDEQPQHQGQHQPQYQQGPQGPQQHYQQHYSQQAPQQHYSQQAPPQQHYQQQGPNQHYQQQAYPQQGYAQPNPQAHRVTISTQTEPDFLPNQQPNDNLSQNGLRNTVELGQKSQPDPSLDDRNQRSLSAPPESHANQGTQANMSQSPPRSDQSEQHSNVRHIPIFVEGRNEPVINRGSAHAPESKPAYQSPPVEREQYFPDEATNFHHPPNFSRAFGSPFAKGFRQGPQPFVQQRVYPQTGFGRANSPQRSQSPHMSEEHYVKVPVHHEKPGPKPESPRPQQQHPQQQHPQQHPQQQHPQQQHPQQHQQQQHAQPQQQQPPPPPKPQTPPSNDPITQILAIQTDVLNLMNEVENFAGTKKDKRYIFLDEMLTRNLIKLDNIETEGKENIRQARKEAIRCIQKCIAVLEAKADQNASTPAPDVEMDSNQGEPKNEEVEMKEEAKESLQAEVANVDVQNETAEVPPVDTRPAADAPATETPSTDTLVNNDKKAKKKVVKKRDKSKDSKDSVKTVEAMHVEDKGDKENSQMEVDGSAAASQ